MGSPLGRLLRMERELRRIARNCSRCGGQPQLVSVVSVGDAFVPPPPCPKCGETVFKLIVTGAPCIPAVGDPDGDDAA